MHAIRLDKLGKMGALDTQTNMDNKISRGGFSAVLFVRCQTAIRWQFLDVRVPMLTANE